jgi:hypothetical protein
MCIPVVPVEVTIVITIQHSPQRQTLLAGMVVVRVTTRMPAAAVEHLMYVAMSSPYLGV